MGDVTGQLGGLCILIAEDDRRIARLLVDLIELHDGRVAGPTAREEEAWKIIDSTRIDAAILDVRLKSTTCFSLADELIHRSIPMVLITGYALSEIPDAYSHLPAFTKPFRVAPLVECVANCCRGSSVPPLVSPE
jgi:DNA-binding NtrC family response regulator